RGRGDHARRRPARPAGDSAHRADHRRRVPGRKLAGLSRAAPDHPTSRVKGRSTPMPLPIPSLDDRDYDQLADEARALIPRNLPAWTDHNPSDPGITLQELFAFLVEIGIYQLNRVPERSLRRFADLVSVASSPSLPIDARLREAL